VVGKLVVFQSFFILCLKCVLVKRAKENAGEDDMKTKNIHIFLTYTFRYRRVYIVQVPE